MHCGLHVTMHVALVISSIVGISDNVSVLILSFAFMRLCLVQIWPSGHYLNRIGVKIIKEWKPVALYRQRIHTYSHV